MATELSDDDHLVIDEEGGARVTNPKTRFVAPALEALASVAATSRDPIDPGDFPRVPRVLSGGELCRNASAIARKMFEPAQ